MRVGITYDLKQDYEGAGLDPELIAEFDAVETIDGIEGALRNLGFETERIGHVKNLVGRLAKGERWDLVFNIAEGLYGIAREAQIPALLEAYQIPFVFSDAATLTVCLDKAMTKRVLRDYGVPTAPYAVIRNEDEINSVDLSYPLFLKPIAEGSGKGISNGSMVTDKAAMATIAKNLLKKFAQPVLVETYLPGREFTVGITGTGQEAAIIGIVEVSIKQRHIGESYGFENKRDWFDHISYHLIDERSDPVLFPRIKDISLAAWNALGCRDGGRLDVRCDAAGNPFILEINPLAGLRPGFSDLCILASYAGLSYDDLIGRIVASAGKRYGWAIAPLAKARKKA